MQIMPIFMAIGKKKKKNSITPTPMIAGNLGFLFSQSTIVGYTRKAKILQDPCGNC